MLSGDIDPCGCQATEHHASDVLPVDSIFGVCDGPVIHMSVLDVTDLGPNIVDIKTKEEEGNREESATELVAFCTCPSGLCPVLFA